MGGRPVSSSHLTSCLQSLSLSAASLFSSCFYLFAVESQEDGEGAAELLVLEARRSGAEPAKAFIRTTH